MIVLDTNALIWLAMRAPLAAAARQAIENAIPSNDIAVSAVSAWEIGNLVRLGRLTLSLPLAKWFAAATSQPGFRILPLDADVALASAELPGWDHRDPADRLLVATARSLDALLVTRDRGILDYAAAGHVRAIAC